MEIPRLTLPDEVEITGVSIIKQFSVRETFPLHRHDFAELFFVGQGRAMHTVNGAHQLLERGSLVFIRPDDAHCFSPINYFDFVMYSLGFPREEACRAADYLGLSCNGGELPPLAVLHGGERGEMERACEELLATHTPARLTHFRAMLPRVLALLFAPQGPGGAGALPAWLARLDEAMRVRENYVEGLPRMLEMCPYSQEYLNRMFRLHMKSTPTEYINALRMEYATELLLEGRRSVTEVCFLSGFNNLSHFYAVFRRLYGCPPREFLRRRNGKEIGGKR